MINLYSTDQQATPPAESNRSAAIDRRQNQSRSAFYSMFRRRRASVRRGDELDRPQYLDVHEPWVIMITVAVVLLSMFDSIFTLHLLQMGSEELNPVMDYLLQRDTRLFLAVKFGLTAVCVIFLVMHKKFKLFNAISGYQMLVGAFGLYFLLVTYEVSMLTGWAANLVNRF